MTDEDRERFTATVCSRTLVSPGLVRLGFSVPDDAVGSGYADEFVTLSIPSDDPEEPVTRYYTIRAWRQSASTSTGTGTGTPGASEIDIEFVLHGHGPAASWAARATIGDSLELNRPRGHYAPVQDARWIMLAGDATALPAIARILEERAEDGPPMTVLVAVEQLADRITLPALPGDAVHWFDDPKLLVSAVTEQTSELAGRRETGYLWFSGEAADMRGVRGHVRRTLQRPTSEWMTMAYWRKDSERWRERFDSRGPELLEQFERIYATDEDHEVQRDRADELFERHGL